MNEEIAKAREVPANVVTKSVRMLKKNLPAFAWNPTSQ
jgi:hypothetical protein